MVFCQIGELGTSFLYMALFVFSLFLEWYSLQDIEMENVEVLLIIVVFFNLSEVFCILFEIIVRIRTKTSYKKDLVVTLGTKIKIVPQPSQAKKLIPIYLFIILLDSSTTFCFVYSCYYIKVYNKDSALDTLNKGIQIIFTFVASKIILHYKIEKYKILALIIMLLGFIMNAVISTHSLKKKFDYFLYLIQVLMNCGTAIQEVIEKYLIHKKYQSPFLILFFEGLIGNIIILIFFFGFNGYSEKNKNWFLNNILNLFVFAIVCVGYTCFRIIINRKTTPTHRIVADTFYSFLLHIISIAQARTSNKTLLYISLIGYIIIVLGSLIYNEYIILKFWEFDRDTKKEIDMRAFEEIAESEEIITKEYELFRKSTNTNQD